MESLSALKPVFPDWGRASTTAGNASGIGDGAALCILTTRARAQQEGMEIIGKWVGSAVVGTLTYLSRRGDINHDGQAWSQDTWGLVR